MVEDAVLSRFLMCGAVVRLDQFGETWVLEDRASSCPVMPPALCGLVASSLERSESRIFACRPRPSGCRWTHKGAPWTARPKVQGRTEPPVQARLPALLTSCPLGGVGVEPGAPFPRRASGCGASALGESSSSPAVSLT